MIATYSTKDSQILETLSAIKTLEEYLNMKVSQKDWHGVSDAANDIRVLEMKIQMLEELL